MPSSRTKPKPLSDSEIEHIAAEIAAGRPPMVWFTSAAVGVPEGRSGKVVALGDPAEGDFLQVRPTGSKDALSFSPVEVTLSKPPRERQAAASGRSKPAPRKEPPVTQPSTATPASPAPARAADRAEPAAAPAAKATAKDVAAEPRPSTQDKPAAPRPAPAKTTKSPARKKTPEVTVTLAGTADGEWTVEVATGKKRSVRGLPVSSAAVAQAAKLLHPEVAEVVAGVLEAAKQAQLAKVEQLQAELAAAKRALEELDS
ncbi:DUF6319 family protein [Nocardia farcinica]|uniref:DUF6319 family protein n=1 Tax=Nocardia farcinica TaxID=37329 RepID=UPI002457B527|nr:DUF6319 family protein [Nocardia farcinica]